MENGVFYTRDHPGSHGEKAIAQLLKVAMSKYDSRFNEKLNAYWTIAIRIARMIAGSKWNLYT